MSFNSELKKVKDANQDFEWYPTTEEMISVIKDDFKNGYQETRRFRLNGDISILDVGAGNGKVLLAFSDIARELFAIEKSSVLVDSWMSIIGSDLYLTKYTTNAQYGEETTKSL